MNNRLAQIINYKTDGRKRRFCELCGWSPQYLQKLLAGENFGLKPIVTLAEKLPELNLRWLLLGDGEMLDSRDALMRDKDVTLAFVRAALDAERFLVVMTPQERKEFEVKLASGIVPFFEPAERTELESRLLAHSSVLDAKFAAAIAKSEEICRQ